MADSSKDYLRFNADSIESLIKQKLEPQFPDVNYEGSSANIVSEAISSVFELLSFQVNRSAANSSFGKTNSLSSIIEQTQFIGYKPTGYQASSLMLDFYTSVFPFPAESYVLPRYSFVDTPVGRYSISEDIHYTTQSVGQFDDWLCAENVLTKGGSWVEYPSLFSDGDRNQQMTINRGVDLIDNNSIHVYVKLEGGSWERYYQTESLFLSSGYDKHFETRYNSQGGFDIYFGDGINGVVLPDGAEVGIYYLAAHNPSRTLEVSESKTVVARYITPRLDQILLDTYDLTEQIVINNAKDILKAVNVSKNTDLIQPESIEDIKKNAPSVFQSQNRLITNNDFKSFIENNFSDFIDDVLILSNQEYLDTYMKYYYELGLNEPYLEVRSLYNQIEFADSCNFNNVYAFLLPKSGGYLSDIQKNMIINQAKGKMTLTSELVPADPIYIEFGLATPNNEILKSDLDTSKLEIKRSDISNRSYEDIRQEAYSIITNYFDSANSTFESGIDLEVLNNKLLSISGVQEIKTTNGSVSAIGLALYRMDPKYPDKVYITSPKNNFSSIFVPVLSTENLLERIEVS